MDYKFDLSNMTAWDFAQLMDLADRIKQGDYAQTYVPSMEIMIRYAKFDLKNIPVDCLPLAAEAFVKEFEKEFPPERFR